MVGDWWATISSSASANLAKASMYSLTSAGLPTAANLNICCTCWPAGERRIMSASSSVKLRPRPNIALTRLRFAARCCSWASELVSAAMTLTPAMTNGCSNCADGRNSRR